MVLERLDAEIAAHADSEVGYATLKKPDLSLHPADRWFCVHTSPRKEPVAAYNLKCQGYRYFMPMTSRRVRHARRTTIVQSAFFPRYIFVILNLASQRWRPIQSTIGVTSIIMGNERPKPVPEGVVEKLIDATNTDGFVDFRTDIAVGQKVRLLGGPFADYFGMLTHLDDKGRVTVLLQILGGERLIKMQSLALQPVE
jgi:transcriptional antiterminator RfaH